MTGHFYRDSWLISYIVGLFAYVAGVVFYIAGLFSRVSWLVSCTVLSAFKRDLSFEECRSLLRSLLNARRHLH